MNGLLSVVGEVDLLATVEQFLDVANRFHVGRTPKQAFSLHRLFA